jgi:hypothetical protein
MAARVLSRLASGLGLLVVFAASAALAVLIHVNSPLERRLITTLIPPLLASELKGSFELDSIERIERTGVVFRGFRARDPRGREVIRATTIRVEANLVELLSALLLGPRRLSIVLEQVQIASAEAWVYDDTGAGIPSIAEAFTPRGPSTGRGRPVRLAIRAIDIERVRGRGSVAGLPVLTAELALVRGWLRVSEAGVDLSFQRFSTKVDGLPRAQAKGIGSLRLLEPGFLRASFDGTYGALSFTSRLRKDDDQLRLTLNLPRAKPEELRGLLGAYPLVDDIALSAEVAGALPHLVASTRLEVGQGVVLGSGTVDLAGGLRASVDVDARRVNVRSLVPGAPPTELDLVLALDYESSKQGPMLAIDAEIEPTVLGEFAVPPLTVTGRYAAERFVGRVLLEEPGFPLHVAFDARNDGVIDFKARSRGLELSAVPRLRRALDVGGRADFDARAHIEKGSLDADLELSVGNFHYGNIRADRAALKGSARGRLSDWQALELDLSLTASSVALGGASLSRMTAKINGPLRAPLVRAAASDLHGGSLAAEGVVAISDGGVRLTEPKLEAQREGLRASGRAALASVDGRRIELRELALHVEGPAQNGVPTSGDLSGTIVYERDLLELDARAQGLDLAAARTLLGLGPGSIAGKLGFEAQIVIARDLRRGKLTARLDDGVVGPTRGVTATAEASLEGTALVVDAGATFENLGELRARVRGEVAGNPLEPRAFREMTGEATLDVIRVELGALGALAGKGRLPALRGAAGGQITLRRTDATELPSAALVGYTDGFGIDVPREGEPLRVDDVDLRFGVNVQGGSGETDATLKLVDTKATLATLSLQTVIDVERLLSAPERAVVAIKALPISGKLRVEERNVDSLPEPLRPKGVSGILKLEANLAGSLWGPDVFARASLEGLELTSVRSERPLDVCTSLGYSHAERRFAGSGEIFLSREAGVCAGRRLVRYAVDGRLVPELGSTLGRLEGTLVAELERLPLEALPGLGDEGLSGLSSGTLSLSRGHGPPVVFARFELEGTRVHGVPIGDGTLDVRSNDRAIAARLKLAHEQSQLEATGLALLDTSSALPIIDLDEPIGARITAQDVDAVILLPFTRSVFSEIGGRLDAELDLLVGPSTSADGPPGGRVSGRAALRNGTLQLAGLGLHLNSVELVARAEPQGKETRITVEALEARAGRRRERVRVRNGKVWLDGVRIARAEGTVEANDLPLLLEGVSQATATTRQGIGFSLLRTPTQMEATFDVPYLSVTLPQSSARGVISLAENRSIEVLQPLGEPKRAGGEGLPWLLKFQLGRDVKLTRSDLELPLSGKMQVLLAEKTEITGDLELAPGGRIQVSGKTFVIDSGEAHFDTGDPANPRLRVSATWRAPDGTIVIADVSGNYQQARLRLSSDPPRSEQDIYALLLGGTGSGGEGGDPTATGAGVGADLLGSLLVNTPLRQVEFRAGSEQLTDQRSYSTYTAAVPISDEVWFEGSYKSLNTSDPTQERDAFSGTIDWRFRRNWSLRTEVGTIGTGLDLVWQYRY